MGDSELPDKVTMIAMIYTLAVMQWSKESGDYLALYETIKGVTDDLLRPGGHMTSLEIIEPKEAP